MSLSGYFQIALLNFLEFFKPQFPNEEFESYKFISKKENVNCKLFFNNKGNYSVLIFLTKYFKNDKSFLFIKHIYIPI